MVEMKFYRDDEYVYLNNPDGTTRKVAIDDFWNAVSGEGGSGGTSGVDFTDPELVSFMTKTPKTIATGTALTYEAEDFYAIIKGTISTNWHEEDGYVYFPVGFASSDPQLSCDILLLTPDADTVEVGIANNSSSSITIDADNELVTAVRYKLPETNNQPTGNK